jgi:Rrf2 family protein
VQISAKADYALRAVAELACAGSEPVKGEHLARSQHIPLKFLENILLELKHAGIVGTQRGVSGGYFLARPASAITLADVLRVVDGPLANVRGQRPEAVTYEGAAQGLQEVWIAVRASLRAVLEAVTIADLTERRLPPAVRALVQDREAWLSH